MYHKADIYLLDDPLSAVDAHTGAHIFNECISGLLQDKTVLLPVHNLAFLDRADYIVALEEQSISEQGTFTELMQANQGFAAMMEEFASKQQEEADSQSTPGGSKKSKDEADPGTPGRTPSGTKGDGKMMEVEERSTGGVEGDVYIYYLRQASIFAV